MKQSFIILLFNLRFEKKSSSFDFLPRNLHLYFLHERQVQPKHFASCWPSPGCPHSMSEFLRVLHPEFYSTTSDRWVHPKSYTVPPVENITNDLNFYSTKNWVKRQTNIHVAVGFMQVIKISIIYACCSWFCALKL